MKRVLLLGTIFWSIYAQAQSDYKVGIKLGGGYAHDFPGMNGNAVHIEGYFPFFKKMEGAIGLKNISITGMPRTKEVEEYTKANTVDFSIYYLPIATDRSTLRIGLGYSFIGYSIRRTYPAPTNTDPTTPVQTQSYNWPKVDTKSRTSGSIVVVEYAYRIGKLPLSIGARAAYYKAYDGVSFVGGFLQYEIN
ncbi:MAG: hypothetical protein K2P88_01990 [Chitinophagaceae bacterium]|uniref:hypothetical protein n=1 Tax=unclassified Paraflavitalea TaxID=2798305 RepID=UPI003D33E40A|nr:hypothetical protein [Chitinophagaceae bacterium]